MIMIGNRYMIKGDEKQQHAIYPDAYFISKKGEISKDNPCTKESELYVKVESSESDDKKKKKKVITTFFVFFLESIFNN